MTTTPIAALVEEAERLSERASPGPWRQGSVHAAEEVWAAYPEGMAGLASERLLLRLNPNFTREQDTTFIARARTLVPELATALRRAEAERDAQRAEVLRLTGERDAAIAMEADTARRSSAEIDSLKAELNEARGEVEDLNRRVEELYGQRDKARAHIATLELLRRGGK